MNGQRDIDRTLEVWFLDGPSVMPDRLFDAVFDQVERVPQRRLARLNLRFADMNPRIRLFTVLAAALLVVVATLAVIGGGGRGVVQSSPSPSAGPTAAGQLPNALLGTWMGAPGGLLGLDPEAGMAAVFPDQNSFWMTQSASSSELRVRADAVSLPRNRVQLTAQLADPDCDAGDVGVYRWTVTPSGQILTIVAETDACAARQTALRGTWELMDCPTADDNCLGVVEAGTHASHFIDPFLANGEDWAPRFEAISYTVPDGWMNVEDWPAFFRLAPVDAPEGTGIYITSDVVLVSESDVCQDVQDLALGTTAGAMANAIADGPGLVVTPPAPVTIGGLEGLRLDISRDPAWTAPCPWSEGRPARPIFTDRSPTEGFNYGVEADSRARIYLLDVGPGRAILVSAESLTSADYAAHVDELTAVVEALQFHP